MSHSPEREDKHCLNCGTALYGFYCHKCGQENIETRESFWTLTQHFVFDILHFDGKFFSTLKALFTRPGLAARRYAEGKRASYLHPIRMYLFTSAVFFLILFSTNKIDLNKPQISGPLTNKERLKLADIYNKRLLLKPGDTAALRKRTWVLDTLKIPALTLDSLNGKQGVITFTDKEYTSIAEYDSAQARLPARDRDGWFSNKLLHQSFKISNEYRGQKGGSAYFESFTHKLPYILFTSLPFFAAILKLLYVRRKNFYYSDHAVFTLYHYIFTFIIVLLMYGLSAVYKHLGWTIFRYLEIFLGLCWPVYLYAEMKFFYKQSIGKTIVKYIALNFLGLIVVLILFCLFLLFAIFQA